MFLMFVLCGNQRETKADFGGVHGPCNSVGLNQEAKQLPDGNSKSFNGWFALDVSHASTTKREVQSQKETPPVVSLGDAMLQNYGIDMGGLTKFPHQRQALNFPNPLGKPS